MRRQLRLRQNYHSARFLHFGRTNVWREDLDDHYPNYQKDGARGGGDERHCSRCVTWRRAECCLRHAWGRWWRLPRRWRWRWIPRRRLGWWWLPWRWMGRRLA